MRRENAVVERLERELRRIERLSKIGDYLIRCWSALLSSYDAIDRGDARQRQREIDACDRAPDRGRGEASAQSAVPMIAN